jgi:hypothetical protein
MKSTTFRAPVVVTVERLSVEAKNLTVWGGREPAGGMGRKARPGLLADEGMDDAVRSNHQECLGVQPEDEQIPSVVKSEACRAVRGGFGGAHIHVDHALVTDMRVAGY